MKLRYETMLKYAFKGGRLGLFFKYQYNIKENNYSVFDTEKSQDYINQSITGGVKWNLSN